MLTPPIIKVRFKPGNEPLTPRMGGISWSNNSVRDAFRSMFALAPDEEIEGVELTELGVRAHIAIRKDAAE